MKPGVVCPIPLPLDHATARKHYNDVKKDMPSLSGAAQRREAARRAGVDYDTFLKAWKKPGAIVPPVGPTPPLPPTGLTREAAREAERAAAKRLGLKPGSAAARKAAADDLGMAYDDFLQAWKGVKPVPTPPGEPGVPIPNKPGVTKVKPPKVVPETERGVGKVLENAGISKSKTTKVVRTHTGQLYGGGVKETEGYVIRKINGDIYVRLTHTYRYDEAVVKMIQSLEDAGFTVTKSPIGGNFIVSRPLSRSAVGPVRILGQQRATEEIERLVATDELLTPNAIKRELKDQLSYLPDRVGNDFKGVLGKDPKDLNYFDKADNQGVLAYYRPTPRGGRYITMGKRPQVRGFTERHVDMQHSGWFSRCTHGAAEVGDGVRNVFAHEFGHFVDDMSRGAQISKRAELLAEITSDMGLTPQQAAEFVGHADWTDSSLKAAAQRNVSRYGSTNLHEFFAEVWAEYSRAGVHARPQIQKWGTLLQDLVESL